ncbi:MAG TPA: DUF3618 domain-containing protein [Stellaceae bacterium]|nr:DUF3618 domain-containing protein [Stellaceae bacterium]
MSGRDAEADPVPSAALGPEEEPELYDGNKPAEEIEQDIAHTRADLSATLDALERRLAPRQLLEKGVDMLRDSMNGDLGRLGERIRANPLPLALIGAGIGWLVLSETGGSRALGDATRSARQRLGRSVSDAAGRAGEMARSVADKAGGVASGAAERVKSMIGTSEESYATPEGDYAYARPKTEEGFQDRMAGYGAETRGRLGEAASTARETMGGAARAVGAVGERASHYAGYAGEQVYRARDRISELMDEHPLALGALGLLAGAVLGMALPATRVEDEYFGETRERVIGGARELGREALDRAEKVADAAVEAARKEVSGEGSAESEKAEEGEARQPS